MAFLYFSNYLYPLSCFVATPGDDIIPNNAITDLVSTELGVNDQKDLVGDIKDLIDEVAAKWDSLTAEARTKTIGTAIENILSDGSR